ncbi:hypothetical protein L2U69_08395 [Zavarzinia compransoris]|uniref:mitofilin family membrane protein n=1 Tax=Zavarzinia marina TaxID=2911065 RepID=UPI001EEE7F45|nr:mitofilin family membrane protein [Zavarzinia marina]MCF4165659.1 hypothetical protein [Zavarzinia marina]
MSERPDQPGQGPDQRGLDRKQEGDAADESAIIDVVAEEIADGDGEKDETDAPDPEKPETEKIETEAVAEPAPEPEAEPEVEAESAPVMDKPLEDPPPRMDSPDYAVPPPSRGSRRSLWFGVAAIVLVAAGAGVWHRYGDRLTHMIDGTEAPASPVAEVVGDPRVDALEAAVAGLDRKIQAVEARVAELGTAGPAESGGASDSGALAELRAELSALRERQGVLEESLTEAGSEGDMAEGGEGGEPSPAPVADPMSDPALSARLAAIDAKLAAPSGDAAAIAALRQEIADMKAAAAASNARIADETDRLRAVGRGVSLVYAIGHLRNAISSERPYDGALAPVRRHFEALDLVREPTIGKALDTLSAHAAEGLATRGALATEFAPLARAAVQAANMPEDADVVDRLLAEAGNLITVRPVGEVEGDDVPARIARAERRLDRGDLEDALAEVAALQGGAAEALSAWKAKAEARLAAEAAVDLLDGEVSARFAEAN